MFFEKTKSSQAMQMTQLSGAHVMAQSQNLQYASLHQILMITGNELKKRQFHVHVSAHASYPATYVGEICLFFARVCLEVMEQGQARSDAAKRWLADVLPITQALPIEIGSSHVMNVLRHAIQSDPLQQIFIEEEMLFELDQFIESQRATISQNEFSH